MTISGLSAKLDELKLLIAGVGEIINDEFPKHADETPFVKSLRIGFSDILSQVDEVQREAKSFVKPNCQCEIYEECDICRADTELDLAKLRDRDAREVRDDGMEGSVGFGGIHRDP